jgi:GWxTD domain-containing protein
MRPTLPETALAVVFALSTVTPRVDGQRPPGADTLSAAAVSESLTVLAGLRKQLDHDRNNAELWYRRGMIAWALHDRDRARGGLRELDWTRLAREADSSIRIAAAIAPANARYRLTQGQYYLGTGWIFVRIQAYHVFDLALASARTSGDASLIAEALVEKGRVHWRRYDPSDFGFVPAEVRQQAREISRDTTVAHALLARDVDSVDADNELTRESLKIARGMLGHQFRRDDGGFTHESDYMQAESYFREAYAAQPAYTRAYQQLAMLFAERFRWTELATLARGRLTREPQNAWAWMTLGLSAHRLGDERQALAAFDSGFARLAPQERARLDDIQRVLRPSDSVMVAGWTAAKRANFIQSYWEWSAPLWSRIETSPRIEFLARVTYAELRWTVDELSKRGADSDRGMVHIRYGPPDARAAERGEETWWYDYARLTWHFRGMPTFATAYFGDADYALDLMDSIPARWDNIVHERVDSLPVRITRFRAVTDSVDVVFASLPPVDAIHSVAAVDGPVRTDFWLFDGKSTAPVHDTAGTRVNIPRSFSKRLATGDYAYRFEASAEGSLRAARAMSNMTTAADPLTGFSTTGFGISDVLLASRAAPRSTPRRWTDFDFDASAGSLAQGASIALMWENYELGERDGSAQYQVTLTLERKYTMLLNRVRARVISAFAAMVGSEQTADRVVFHYDRAAAHTPVIADYVTLVLEDLPGGNYDLTLDITDKVTGRSASRTMRVVVRD